jgi:DNA-binding transcriptional ArsR family regulator
MLATVSRTPRVHPSVFAALGDDVRLRLVERLRGGQALSIAALTADSGLTRQAIRKHLGVLERAGLVQELRQGREHQFRVDPAPLQAVADWAEAYRRDWEDRFDRLDAFLKQHKEA